MFTNVVIRVKALFTNILNAVVGQFLPCHYLVIMCRTCALYITLGVAFVFCIMLAEVFIL